ncbi:MAG: GGDEF domain-containing protein [Oscillospiraceae bacterium]|nr:GGDEF domain-containing protein [Oscillospiraceae bacterium]MBR6677450.1 GGDEF domain-containing protein [Oscillospiraceae bacterium]
MLLALREEALCAMILIFLQIYYAVNKVKNSNALFPKIARIALCHVLLDGITVYTVNHLDIIPDPINRFLHILFYISGALFGMMLYQHILTLCGYYRSAARLKRVGYALLTAFTILLFFLPMKYVHGQYTNYSYSILTIIGYALFLFYCAASLIMLLYSYRKLDRRTRVVLVPILCVMMIAVITQAFFPELLMTGAVITLVILGLFISLDNPDIDYMEQALWDYTTGLKNRNSYERDMAQAKFVAQTKRQSPQIGFLVIDINNLKYINDHYGHQEGDRLISVSADILKNHLKSASSIYRIGGDEFLAVYSATSNAAVEAEMDAVMQACRNAKDFSLPLCLALGYQSGPLDNNVDELLKQADQNMYSCKARLKEEYPLPCCNE